MTDEIVDPTAETTAGAGPAAEESTGDGATAAPDNPTAGNTAEGPEATSEAPAPDATASEPAAPIEAAAPAEEPVAAPPADEPAAAPIAAVTTSSPPPAPQEPAAPPAQMPSGVDEEDARAFEKSLEGADDYSRTFTSLREGDVVQGVVVHIDREGVLVDVGTKSEGIIRRHELSRDTNTPAEELVKVGEKIDVYVMEAENQDGNLILSKKRADFEKAWERVQEAKEQNRTITAMVTDRVKGGLVVDLGIRGFVPASHVGNGSMKNNLERYIGQSIPLKVIEVDKERRKVVLSNKLAADEDRLSRKAETVSSLQVNQIRRGIVRRLTNYGAFIDLGGIDGLLHISEMSWTRINHPQEVLKEGQEIDVVVLKMDLEAGRVSLGLRQILPDPWTGIDERYHPGDLITGSVTRVVPFGVFVQVEGGIEGIIPNAEMSSRKGGKAPALAQGTEVEVKVIDVRPDERKMTLSLRQARQEEEVKRERKEVDDYQARVPEREEPRFTIGDALRAKEEAEAAESATEVAPEPAAQAQPVAEAVEESAEPETAEATATAEPAKAAEEAASEEATEEPSAEAGEEK